MASDGEAMLISRSYTPLGLSQIHRAESPSLQWSALSHGAHADSLFIGHSSSRIRRTPTDSPEPAWRVREHPRQTASAPLSAWHCGTSSALDLRGISRISLSAITRTDLGAEHGSRLVYSSRVPINSDSAANSLSSPRLDRTCPKRRRVISIRGGWNQHIVGTFSGN